MEDGDIEHSYELLTIKAKRINNLLEIRRYNFIANFFIRARIIDSLEGISEIGNFDQLEIDAERLNLNGIEKAKSLRRLSIRAKEVTNQEKIISLTLFNLDIANIGNFDLNLIDKIETLKSININREQRDNISLYLRRSFKLENINIEFTREYQYRSDSEDCDFNCSCDYCLPTLQDTSLSVSKLRKLEAIRILNQLILKIKIREYWEKFFYPNRFSFVAFSEMISN